jgi:hypothetical protein
VCVCACVRACVRACVCVCVCVCARARVRAWRVYGVWYPQFRKSVAKSKKRKHEADVELLEGKAEGISKAGQCVKYDKCDNPLSLKPPTVPPFSVRRECLALRFTAYTRWAVCKPPSLCRSF